MAHCFSKIFFLKKLLIPDYRGLSVKKFVFLNFFWVYSKMAPRIISIFCMSLEDNRVHCLSKIVFLTKFLIQDYRGLSVQERWAFYFFVLYSKTALRIISICCMSVRENGAHCLSKIVFLKNS